MYADEAGSNLGMTPFKAWSEKNHRAYDSRPAARGGNLSLVGAIKKSGIQALYPYDGAVNSERFIHFAETQLLPNLSIGDVLIMDNSPVHRSAAVRTRLDELGIRVLFMPPYSPELNPIEETWSVVKNKLRQRKARTIVDYVDSMTEAKECITPKKCEGFFAHSSSFQYLC